jgi:hypothetical protein
MTPFCQRLPKSVAEEMLQVVARAICDRPGDNPAQRDSRTRQMVYSTMGFDPRDGLEYMLTTMTVGHFNLILDSMFDVFQGQMDTMKARTKSTIVALDRSMLAFVKEMRFSRLRSAVQWTEAPAETTAAEALAEMDVPPAEPAPESSTPPASAGPHMAAKPVTAAVPLQARPRTAAPGPAGAVPRRSGNQVETSVDDATLEEHIAAFQDAFAAATETLAEARALDEAKVASGD